MTQTSSNEATKIALLFIYQAALVIFAHFAAYGCPPNQEGWIKLIAAGVMAGLVAIGAYMKLGTKVSAPLDGSEPTGLATIFDPPWTGGEKDG